MQNLQAGDLVIEVSVEPGGPLRLVWRGRSSERQPGAVLGPFFAEVLDSATSLKVPIELCFQHLEYFNSSTIQAIVQLLQDARARGVRLVVLYDARLKWQKLSFEALRIFGKGDNLLELRAV